jgi:phospholipid transport system substrate-binding protein
MRASVARAFAIPLAVLFAGPQAGATSTAAMRIDAFHERLIDVMQMPDFQARRGELAVVVPQVFDVATIARITLGTTWRTLDATQRDEFQRLLTDLIVATYADRFDRYDDQRFECDDGAPAGDGWVVQCRLLRKSGEPVNLDYYLRDAGVFDVVAGGVSDLSLRRAEYGSIVRDDGYEALLRAIRAAIETHRTGG